MAHHLFSCWHGDYRLRRKYGEVCLTLLVISYPSPNAVSGNESIIMEQILKSC